MRIRGLFFDLGGTLFHHLPSGHTHSNLHEVAASTGCDVEVLTSTYGQIRRELEARYREAPFFLHRQLVEDGLARALEACGVSPASEIISQFYTAQRQAVIDHLMPRDDMAATLQALRARGATVGIVSNIDNDYLEPLVERHSLSGLVDFWLSSETAGSCKPHPGIFEQALQNVAARAERVLFVGDSPANDVDGASKLGMDTALIGPEDGSVGSRAPTLMIDNLADLQAH